MANPPYNFIEDYLDFFSGTEPPTIYNRWCAIMGISAMLGRQCWVTHGHSKIYPNQYVMLVGESGARKSTAIKTYMRSLLRDAGYKTFAANKSSKEKFLLDLQEGLENVNDPEQSLDVTKESPTRKFSTANPTMRELFGVTSSGEPANCLVVSDDFNIFLGHGNIEFIEILTDLWDYEGEYSNRIKTGKSVLILDPTINICGGNTQLGISMSFPPETIGQGFFSRLIQVFSEPSGRRISFPPPADVEKRKRLVAFLAELVAFRGEIKLDAFAMLALDTIYQEWKDLNDVRFKSYSTRRFTHLLKLCLCCAASIGSRVIDSRTVTYANSILHYTEFFMPKALGEFGKARNSDVNAKILDLLNKTETPLRVIEDIYPEVHRDLESASELVRIMQGLVAAGKVQQVAGGGILIAKEKMEFNFPHCNVLLLREYVDYRTKEGLPI